MTANDENEPEGDRLPSRVHLTGAGSRAARTDFGSRRVATAFVAGLLVIALGVITPVDHVMAADHPPRTQRNINPPGNADEAVRREFSMIERQGTREAYERFIRRHPRHALAAQAKLRLRSGRLKPAD